MANHLQGVIRGVRREGTVTIDSPITIKGQPPAKLKRLLLDLEVAIENAEGSERRLSVPAIVSPDQAGAYFVGRAVLVAVIPQDQVEVLDKDDPMEVAQ